MNITKEQSMAYTEVLEIFKYMSKEDVNKIPPDLINYFVKNMDKSYIFNIDIAKSFEEQQLSEHAKIVLALLFRDYWATKSQKEKILQKEKSDLYQIELEKQKKYNTNDLFPNKHSIKESSLVVYQKETWYTNFFNFIKKLFKKH